jgi:hypothetical protein
VTQGENVPVSVADSEGGLVPVAPLASEGVGTLEGEDDRRAE